MKILAFALLFVLSTATGVAQGTPSADLAESDALFGGNHVDQLPSCEIGEVCLATLNQVRDDEYFAGILHNDTDETIYVENVTATIRDSSGSVAAVGDSFTVAPAQISPGGHAIVGLTLTGEYGVEGEFSADINYIVGESDSGFGVPLQVIDAQVRGDGVVGEIANVADMPYPAVYIYVACFNDDGEITYRGSSDAATLPLEIGSTSTFGIPLYSTDCQQFIVVAWGNPFA